MSSSCLCSLHPVEGVSPVRAVHAGGSLPPGVPDFGQYLLQSSGLFCRFSKTVHTFERKEILVEERD